MRVKVANWYRLLGVYKGVVLCFIYIWLNSIIARVEIAVALWAKNTSFHLLVCVVVKNLLRILDSHQIDIQSKLFQAETPRIFFTSPNLQQWCLLRKLGLP